MSCTEGVCRCSWEGALEGRGSEPISEGFSLTAATAWKLSSTRSCPGVLHSHSPPSCFTGLPTPSPLGRAHRLSLLSKYPVTPAPPSPVGTILGSQMLYETSQEISGNGHIWIARNLREGFLGISMKTGSSNSCNNGGYFDVPATMYK